MPIELDKKYSDYPIYAQKIETKASNPHFINGEVAVQIYIENCQNFLDVIEDGGFLILKGEAGTKNNFHIVKLVIKKDTAYFEATSDFLKELPCKQILLEDIQQAPIYAKILFTISNRMNQEMAIDFDAKPSHHLNPKTENEKEQSKFTLVLPSERNCK